MRVIDITVSTPPAAARDAVAGYLQSERFALAWADEWSAVAERGSKNKQMFLGAFAEYFKFAFRVMTAPDGSTVVRIEKQATGWMGGAIGASKATKQFNLLRDTLGNFFSQRGEFVGVIEQNV